MSFLDAQRMVVNVKTLPQSLYKQLLYILNDAYALHGSVDSLKKFIKSMLLIV